MPRPKHEHQQACVDWLAEDPTRTFGEAAVRYGVPYAKTARWYQIAQEQKGKVVYPPRVKVAVPAGGQKKTALAFLPPPLPPPPKPLDPELTSLARTAARNLLEYLSDKKNLKDASIKDVAITLKTITDSYELLPQVDGKHGGTAPSADRRLVDALMGKMPEQDEEDDDPLAVVRGDHA